MKLFVGQTRLGRSARRYSERFDMVELRAEPARLPRAARLREWRAEAGHDFVFSLVVPSGAYDPTTTAEALGYAARVAEVLEPAWWVLRPPPSWTPAASSVRRLERLVASLPAGPRHAWEPSGPWDAEGTARVGRQLGLFVVRDGSRDDLPPGDVVYTRLRALGEGANVGVSAAERLAERLAGRREAYVVVEGAGAGRVRSVLEAELDVEHRPVEGDEADDEDLDVENDGFVDFVDEEDP